MVYSVIAALLMVLMFYQRASVYATREMEMGNGDPMVDFNTDLQKHDNHLNENDMCYENDGVIYRNITKHLTKVEKDKNNNKREVCDNTNFKNKFRILANDRRNVDQIKLNTHSSEARFDEKYTHSNHEEKRVVRSGVVGLSVELVRVSNDLGEENTRDILKMFYAKISDDIYDDIKQFLDEERVIGEYKKLSDEDKRLVAITNVPSTKPNVEKDKKMVKERLEEMRKQFFKKMDFVFEKVNKGFITYSEAIREIIGNEEKNRDDEFFIVMLGEIKLIDVLRINYLYLRKPFATILTVFVEVFSGAVEHMIGGFKIVKESKEGILSILFEVLKIFLKITLSIFWGILVQITKLVLYMYTSPMDSISVIIKLGYSKLWGLLYDLLLKLYYDATREVEEQAFVGGLA